MVDALTWWPSLSSSPWILLYPQPQFSVASRAISVTISALTGGRPARFGWVHFRVTRWRCPPQDGAGGDQPAHSRPCRQQPDQRGEDRAVGPVQPGAWIGPAQHGDLVPQHEQLRVL